MEDVYVNTNNGIGKVDPTDGSVIWSVPDTQADYLNVTQSGGRAVGWTPYTDNAWLVDPDGGRGYLEVPDTEADYAVPVPGENAAYIMRIADGGYWGPADPDNPVVEKLDSGGTSDQVGYNTGSYTGAALAWGPDENTLYVLTENRLQEHAEYPNWENTSSSNWFELASGVDYLYAGDTDGNIDKVDPSNGNIVGGWSVSNAQYMGKIAFGGGNLIVAFRNFSDNYRIHLYDPSGTLLWETSGKDASQDVAADGAGYYYRATTNDPADKLDSNGNVEWSGAGIGAVGAGGPPVPANTPPTADFTYSKSSGTVDFTDASSDPDGSISSWSWDFGDGATSTQQSPSHTYSSSGTYTVQLTVTDDAGATGSAGKDVSVTVTVTGSGSLTGSPETLSGSATLPITGSGALTDKKASTSTAATLPIGGSGALTGSKESLTAAATLPISGTGSLTGGQEETAAAAALPITGEGAGEGALNDTGEALSAAAVLPISGSGDLADREETVAGVATLSIVGSGSLAGRGEGLTGDATLLIVGSGTLADRKEAIDGGNIVTGAGSLTGGKEEITGDATLPITGDGSLTGRQTRLETAAVLPITGSGMLTGSPETIFGGTFSRLTELNGSLEESLGSDTSLRTTLDFSIDLNK